MSTDYSQEFRRLTSQRENYVLLRSFHMPIGDESRHAIAVTLWASKILQSFYTLMVSVIIFHLWYIFVLVVMALAYRSKKSNPTRNHGAVNVAIWNSQASPLSIIKSMFEYRTHIPRYAFFWAFCAFLAWAGAFTMSLLISPTLIIGTAAPANLEEIYVPTQPELQGNLQGLRWQSLQVPTFLRAIEVLQGVDSETGDAADLSDLDVVVQPSRRWEEAGNNMLQVDYSYNITGVHFGLQNLPRLRMEVRGSCRTEYSWYQKERSDSYNENFTPYTDIYEIFGEEINVTTADGRRPVLFYSLNSDEPQQSEGNFTFAIVPSTLKRRSFTEGTDPWYETQLLSSTDAEEAPYEVLNGRPPLSCWEQTLWSHRGGPAVSMDHIRQLNPKLPPGIQQIFQDALSIPRILVLALGLGNMALKSSQTFVGLYFDAQTATIHSDLQRLVYGAFISTRNVLAETTLFDRRYENELPNLVVNQSTKQYLAGVEDFVIYGSGFAALSVKVLIIIPIITVVLFFSVSLLTDNPFYTLPWGYVNALKAPVLYSALDHEGFKEITGDKWKRASTTPHYPEKDQPALVRPKLEGRFLSWGSSGQE